MKKRPKTISIVGLVVVVVVAFVIWLSVSASMGPGPYDSFAQCLRNKNVVFYGTFWCPHCQAQKELFGKSARYLPYVECSLPSGQDQTPICEQKGIKGYPTWEFTNPETQTSSRLAGEVGLQRLSEESGCALLQGT
jgi:thiol-disulfide isomerase/thioredoxin